MSRYGLGLYGAGYYSRDPFPLGPLPIKVEADLNGWTDITTKVYTRGEIAITRGRSDETGTAQNSSCSMQLNNRSGNFSPRNPSGSYYGYLGRNTPLRVSITEGERYLYLSGLETDCITAPDSVALSITGDIEVQVDLELNNWVDGANDTGIDLAGKYSSTAGQRSWALDSNNGYLRWIWSTDGSTTTTVTSTVRPCAKSMRMAVKVTHDVNDGAGNNVVTFYTADTIDGTWTQLGEAVTTAGTTSIFDSTSAVCFGGAFSTATSDYGAGKLFAGKVKNGIGGTTVASPDLRTATAGASSFSDGTNTWTKSGTNAVITNRQIRYIGEVPSWPTKWDQSVTDIWTPIQVSGILRRLTQGVSPLRSPMYRGVIGISTSQLKAYWPCEDGSTSESIATALTDGYNMLITGSPSLASDTSFVCSSDLGSMNSSIWRGRVRTYSGTDHSVAFLMKVPSGGATNNSVICQFKTTGDAALWKLVYTTGGALNLTGYDSAGVSVVTTGAVAFNVNGKLLDVHLLLDDTGTDISVSIVTYEVGATAGSATTVTYAAANITSVTEVAMAPDGLQTTTVFGHIRVENSVTAVFDLQSQVNAWKGEAAGRRIKRLCDEEGVEFVVVGDPHDTAPMGYQTQKTLLELVRECEASDAGMIFEPREYLALGYRTKKSLYSQNAALTLDYASNDLSVFEPVDDDQTIQNDVTVSRIGGSSARQVDEDSALSVNAPPSGVGKYDTEYSLSLSSDTYLDNHAYWRLHLGTVDEQRYPGFGVELQRSNFTNDAALYADATDVDLGSRVVIENVPTTVAIQDVEQIILGYTEVLSQFNRKLDFNSAPASAYYVAHYETVYRYSGVGTVTNEALDTTETGVDITVPTGVEWTTVDGSYDIVIGGEVMTVTSVTALSGTSQTFTVTRSVNGIVKSHSTGAAVSLATPCYWALTR